MNTNNTQTTQPKNTAFIPLAGEIPQYRQAKLAGRRFTGPMRNIVSIVSDIHKTTTAMHPQSKPQPIKGQAILSPTQKPSSTNADNVRPNPALSPTPKSAQTKAYLPASSDLSSPTTQHPPQVNKNTAITKAQQQLSQQSNQLQKKLADKEIELKKLKTVEQQRQNQLKALTTQQKTAEAVIQNMKQQVENLSKQQVDKKQLAELKEKIQKKENETRALKEEIASLKKSLEETNKLEAQIINYKNQIIAMTEQQKKLQALVQESEKKLKDLSAQLQQAKQDKLNSQSQIKKLEKLLDDTVKSTLNPPKTHKKIVTAKTQPKVKLPILTRKANAISGIVVDKKGKFIESAVVLIKNVAGQNLRALKTNALGQFVATTPLPSRKYYIEVSKPGHSFDIVEVNLTGGVVPPVLIQSHEITA